VGGSYSLSHVRLSQIRSNLDSPYDKRIQSEYNDTNEGLWIVKIGWKIARSDPLVLILLWNQLIWHSVDTSFRLRVIFATLQTYLSHSFYTR
jgi:hypothetical protein